MLVEIAIADSYGAGFEFADPSPGRPNDVTFFVRNPAYHKLHPGMYTDDTQMTLAVAGCVLEGRLEREDFARSFVEVFQRDRRDGYARKFQAFLESVTDADDFMSRIQPHSERGGAAMRVSPIGLMEEIRSVMIYAERQARITHDTGVAVAAAQGAALMVHHQAYRLGEPSDLPRFLKTHVPSIAWDMPFRDRTRNSAEEIVRAALAVLLDSRTLCDVLGHSVRLGGDTDTVAAIAMAAASVSDRYRRDLPETLVHNLENGPYGREHLADVDRHLARRFPVLGRNLTAGPEVHP